MASAVSLVGRKTSRTNMKKLYCHLGKCKFTDGSCRENPGSCGTGTCILLSGSQEFIELKQPVSKSSSIILGELVAISVTLTFSEKESQFSSIKLFFDSQPAVGTISLGWETKSHKQTVTKIQQ